MLDIQDVDEMIFGSSTLFAFFLCSAEKNQLLLPKTNPSKAGQEASHQHSDEIVQCEWKAGKASSTHRKHRPLENCEDAVNRQFEDGDFIYTNGRP
eukprot:Gb_26900 [translate_table: standard]